MLVIFFKYLKKRFLIELACMVIVGLFCHLPYTFLCIYIISSHLRGVQMLQMKGLYQIHL